MSWLVVKAAASPLEGVSFATDLLLCYDQVRKRVEKSSKIYEEVVLFVRARAVVEETYAEGLRKLAQMSLSPHKGSTMQEALDALRSNLLNKATQHSLLSDQLIACEMLEEVMEHQKKSSSQAKSLVQMLAHYNKEMKTFEDKYRSCSRKYAKAWHESCLRCSEYVANVPKGRRPSISPSRPSQTSSSPSGVSQRKQPNNSSTTPPVPSSTSTSNLAASVDERRLSTDGNKDERIKPSPASTSLERDRGPTPPPSAVGATGHFAQWLMPTGEERVNLANSHLEEARVATMNAWKRLVGAQQRCCLKLQCELSEIQQCEEVGGECLRDLMRSTLVYESSVIANTVYDMENATAPKVSEFEPLKDIYHFITRVRSQCSLHDLSTSSTQEDVRKESTDDLSLNESISEDKTPISPSCQPAVVGATDWDSEEKERELEGVVHTCGGLSLNVPLLARAGAILPKAPISIKRGSGLMFPPPVHAVNPNFNQLIQKRIGRVNEDDDDTYEADLLPMPTTNPWSRPEWQLPVLVSVSVSEDENNISDDDDDGSGGDGEADAEEEKKEVVPVKDVDRLLRGEIILEKLTSIQDAVVFQDDDENQEVYRPISHEAPHCDKTESSSSVKKKNNDAAAAAAAVISSGSSRSSGGHTNSISSLSEGSKVKTLSTPLHNQTFFGSLYRKNGVIMPTAKTIKTVQPWRSLTGIRIIEKASESVVNSAYSSFSSPSHHSDDMAKHPKPSASASSSASASTSTSSSTSASVVSSLDTQNINKAQSEDTSVVSLKERVVLDKATKAISERIDSLGEDVGSEVTIEFGVIQDIDDNAQKDEERESASSDDHHWVAVEKDIDQEIDHPSNKATNDDDTSKQAEEPSQKEPACSVKVEPRQYPKQEPFSPSKRVVDLRD